MPSLFNRVRFITATAGTGTLTVGAAVTKFRTPAQAGIADGTVVRIFIEDGAAWEHSTGTVGGTSTTITRTLVESSTGALLNLSGSAEVFIDAAAQDLWALVPIGGMIPYGGTAEPPKWLFAYGQTVSRTTFAALFAVYGTTYGAGDGSSTFGLPDLRGRVVAGQDDMGGTSANRLTGLSGGVDGDVLGGTGGAQTHALTAAENGPHTHTYTAPNAPSDDLQGGGSSVVRSIITGATTGSSGSGTAHNNVQPTMILNYIIYAGA